MALLIRDSGQAALAEIFNSVLAGRDASDALGEALHHEWLPAMVALLNRPGASSDHRVHVRRLLVRLGWLLQHLPRAQSIHPGLLDRAVREYRSDWRALVPLLFADAKTRQRHVDLLDGELLDSLQVDGDSQVYRPAVARRPLVPVVGVRATPAPLHPHDRSAPGPWQQVLAVSRERRHDEDKAIDALSRIAQLHAGDRVQLLRPNGMRETWRVVRCEATRDHLLLENEQTHQHGVLGRKSMATQLARGRLAILG